MTTTLTIPSDGIILKHDPTVKDLSQVIKLDLNHTLVREVLRSLQSNEKTKIKLGTRCSISTDKRTIPLNHIRQKTSFDFFRGDLDGSKPFYFTGSTTHLLEVHSLERNTSSTAVNPPSSLNSSSHARSSNDLLSAALRGPGQTRPSPLVGARLLSGPRPSSPFLAGLSPRVPPPTSNPLTLHTTPRGTIHAEALKLPMIHLLAVHSHTLEELTNKLEAKHKDCEKLLDKVSLEDVKAGKGKRMLRDKTYQDLDVWKFPYASQQDRQAAIDNAVSAFDRMRLGKSDKLWQMLLAKEDRGKGTCLSRLTHFDKQLTGSLTPKLPERSQDGSTAGKSMHSSGSGTNSKDSKTSDDTSTTKTTPLLKPKVQITDAAVKRLMAGKPTPKAASVKSARAATDRKEAKYKSAEKIENSDDEAQTNGGTSATKIVQKSVVKTKETIIPRVSLAARTAASAAKTAGQKPPSASPNVGNDTQRLKAAPNSKPSKSRSNIDLYPATNTSRPRNDSSPPKPSPLGSSPPTTGRDDNGSRSTTKDAVQSSAASSPPTSAELVTGKQRFSPLVGSVKREKTISSAAKRKAETNDEGPPAKRQQAHGSPAASLPSNHAENVEKVSVRSSPNSDLSLNAEATAITRTEVQKRAEKFQNDYATYKALFDKLNGSESGKRDPGEVTKVWKMHERLEERKEQIWKDWEKIIEREGR